MHIRVRPILTIFLTSGLGLLLLWACSSRDATEVDEDVEAAGLWADLAAAKTSTGMHDLVAQEIVRFAFDEQELVDRRYVSDQLPIRQEIGVVSASGRSAQ